MPGRVEILYRISNCRINQSFLSGVRISVTCRIHVNSHAFRFLTDTLPKNIDCFFVLLRLVVKIDVS